MFGDLRIIIFYPVIVTDSINNRCQTTKSEPSNGDDYRLTPIKLIFLKQYQFFYTHAVVVHTLPSLLGKHNVTAVPYVFI